LRHSFNHVVGAREQHRRHGESECLSRFEIDDEFELSRPLNRQIGRLKPVTQKDLVRRYGYFLDCLLCLSQIKSGHTDDAARPGPDGK
jgi:hypothetical protein